MKTVEWDQLQELAERFESAWKDADSVDLGQFLPSREDSIYTVALHELIKTDLEIRWRRKQIIGIEFYLEKFPDLGGARALPAELIYEEYRVRQMHGDKPELASYQIRFPHQFPELQRLVKEQPIKAPAVSFATMAAPAPQSMIDTKGAAVATSTQKDVVLGVYRKIKRIGAGGFGEVWQGVAPGGIEVAIKVIFRPVDHDEAKRELESLELIKKLRHPFLVQTQQYQAEDDRLYIVMELAEGSLRDRLKECRDAGLPGIPLPELLTYFREAAEGLDYLHGKHLLHRDIKPDNILLVERHAKLADFGLAKMFEKRMATVTGSGTPPYMAPEIWKGKVSEHSDQYALAVTYAEVRLSRRLFPSKDLMQVMLDHLERTPELDPLPPAEQQVLQKALAKEPDQRYPNCLEFVQELEVALAPELGRKIRPGTESREFPVMISSSTEMTGSAGTAQIPTPNVAGQQTWGSRTELPSAGVSWRERGEAPPRRRWWIAALVGLILAVPTSWLVYPYIVTPPVSEPEGDEVILPPGFAQAQDGKIVEAGGRRFYDRIITQKGNQKILFLLMRKEADSDPQTFYIMETKVWNDLFKLFWEDASSEERKELEGMRQKHPGSVKNWWMLGPRVRDPENMSESEKKGLGPDDGTLPVTRVTVTEAYFFARWLGGNLPTRDQWDRAAGLGKGGSGPFQKDWKPGQIAVGRGELGPMPVGTASADISSTGCRDMAGNGREWTRNLREGTETVPLSNPKPGFQDRIEVRGAEFYASGPFEFEKAKLDADSVEYFLAPRDISFRVVIDKLEPVR